MARSLTVLIAGGSGMIGTALRAYLTSEGHDVHVLTRSTSAAENDARNHAWNPGVLPLNLDELAADIGAPIDVIVNLAGASISKMPWTRSYKELILSSRVSATETLVSAISSAKKKPSALINGSAVGFYGNRADEELSESSPQGSGFLADVVHKWEEAASPASPDVRVAYARTGLVLGPQGALAPLRLLTKLCVSGPLAGGKDWWPWISLGDEVRALAWLITHDIAGPVNLVGPLPATSRQVGKSLAKLLKRPFWLPAPGFAIGLVLGEAGRELLLSSQKVVPTALEKSGFTFLDSTVESALASAIN